MRIEYVTYYDFHSVPKSSIGLFFVVGLYLLALIPFIWYFRSANKGNRVLLVLGVVWLGISFLISLAQIHRQNRVEKFENMLNSNQSEVVEGVIENFVPRPIQGHAMESFFVNGIKFEYSDGFDDIGFNRSVARGGSILREGMRIRIHHSGNHILRLEIRKDDYAIATGLGRAP